MCRIQGNYREKLAFYRVIAGNLQGKTEKKQRKSRV
jgi:hypothetical protein